MKNARPKIVVVAGPTASGKTAVSLDLAERFPVEVVSADSIQIYRYLDIGSAKPSQDERLLAPHHMIDIRNPDEDFSAGDFMRVARACIAGILERGNVPMVVGGTGLYLRCLLHGIVELPPPNPEVRARLKAEQEKLGINALYDRLRQLDPTSASRIDPRNVVRIVRCLEVFELTGRRLAEFHAEHAFADSPYDALYLCLTPTRARLYEQIDTRVDCMIKGGLCDEVRQLYERGYSRDLRSLQSLGYRHAGMILAGEIDRGEGARLMKRDTRHYAKRQLTWFRSEPGIYWWDPRQIAGIRLLVANFLGI